MVENKEMVMEEENMLNDKGFSFMYNLTIISAATTVAMFIIGTAIYIKAAL